MGKPIRVLIVEDSEDDAQLLLRELRSGGYDPTYERVDTTEAMSAALDRQKWDVILADYVMPRFSVPVALELMRKKGIDLPFIVISGSIGEEVAVEAVRMGAHDYLMKNNLRRLTAAVEHEIRDAEVRREHRLAGEALRESEERLRSITSSAQDAIISVNDEGQVLYWNEAAVRIFGYSVKEAVGEKIHELIAPDKYRDDILKGFKRFRNTGQGSVIGKTVELSASRKDGTEFPVELSLSAVRVKNKWNATGIVRDITERRRAQEALRESEERYRSITDYVLDSSDVGIFILDKEFRVVWINKAIESYFGLKRDEVIGKDKRRLIKERIHRIFERGDEFAEIIFKTYDNNTYMENFICHVLPGDGREERWLEHKSLPIASGLYAGGRVEHYTDITVMRRFVEELEKSVEKLRRTLGGTVRALAEMVEVRDPYTAGHERRVADLSRAIATGMGLPKEQIDGIRTAASIHDIGKVHIPAEILTKPGRLTENEYDMIKTHPQVGYDILKEIEFPWPVARIVLQHHERMDGSGYPAGLSNGEIILGARIIGVADVIEAMFSHRPYRPALGIDKALEEIARNRGTLYDPAVVDASLKLFKEKGFKFE